MQKNDIAATGRLVPTIRFKGFTDDWEQRKLGDVADKKYGGGTPRTSEKTFWNGKIPWFQSADLIEHEVLSAIPRKRITESGLDKSAAQLIPANSIAIVTRVGVGKLAFMPFSYATSQDFLSLSELNVDGKFGCYSIYRVLQKEKSLTQGTSIKGLTKDELLRKSLMTPSPTEQKRIGVYFSNLDHLITLHQRKIDYEKRVKEYLLQNMFPREGENVPRIRFPGFTDSWEPRKLEDFGKATGGTSIESEFNEKGKYKVISIGSYSENNIYIDQGIRCNLTKKTQNRVLNRNDLTMILNDKTAIGRIIGRVLLISQNDSYVYNQRTERIEPNKNKYDSLFLYEMLNAPNIRNKIISKCQGNTQIYVNWSVISKLEYKVPKLSEQKIIGAFLDNLDHLITLHQRKLESLKELKKGLLQKMFV